MKYLSGLISLALATWCFADVRRVSESTTGGEANDESYYVAISGNGQVVAFSSRASNLVEGTGAQSRYRSQVYLKDLANGQIELVSVQGGLLAGTASQPALNGDGSLIAFIAWAPTWHPASSGFQVFLRDRSKGTTTLISQNAAGQPANGTCMQPTISRDGRFVVYSSHAHNMGTYVSAQSIFLHDRQTGATERISPYFFFGYEQVRDCHRPSISDDGRYVVYEAYFGYWTYQRRLVLLHDRMTGKTSLVSQRADGHPMYESRKATISGDGTKVAFETSVGPGFPFLPRDQQTNVVVRELVTGEYEWVNQGSGNGPDNPVYFHPTLSGNGRFVSFIDNRALVPHDTNDVDDVYLRDLKLRTTVRISESHLGEPNQRSFHTSISDNGAMVAFTSYASNLVPADFNQVADIFVGPVSK